MVIKKPGEILEEGGVSEKPKDIMEGDLTNEAVITILGFTEEEIEGMSDEQIIVPLLQIIDELIQDSDGEMKEIFLEIKKEGLNAVNNKGLLEKITIFMKNMQENDLDDELNRILTK